MTEKEVKDLAKRAKDKHVWVRGGVAINPNTPEHLLHTLSQDKDWFVRGGIARNPNTPEHLLTILSQDKHASVRRYASNTLKDKK
jgi:hypothetical protein